MEQNNGKFRLNLNLFDGIVLIVNASVLLNTSGRSNDIQLKRLNRASRPSPRSSKNPSFSPVSEKAPKSATAPT